MSLFVFSAVTFPQKDDKRDLNVAFTTSSVSVPDIFCWPSWSTLKHSPPCFLPWRLRHQQVPRLPSYWLFFAMGSSGRKWKEGRKCSQVFISLAPFLKGHLNLAMLLSRRFIPSLKGLCKSLPLDSRLSPFLSSGQGNGNISPVTIPKGTVTSQLLLHYPLWCPYTHTFVNSAFVNKTFPGYPI